jgi:hypothetical protein
VRASRERRFSTRADRAAVAGYDCYEAANAHYGKLGRQVAEFLDLAPPIHERRGEPVWTKVLADGDDENEDEHEHWRWKMHQEVVDALRELNMA